MGGGARTACWPRSGANLGARCESEPDRLEAFHRFDGRRPPMSGTGHLGHDGAGVADEVWPGVTGVSLDEGVFGRGRDVQAQNALLDSWAVKPSSVDWAVAAAGNASHRPEHPEAAHPAPTSRRTPLESSRSGTTCLPRAWSTSCT